MESLPFQLIKNEIRKSVPASNLISILLFGSAVASNELARDYDLLIVTRKLPPHDWILAGKIKFNLLGKVDKPLDIVFMEERDLGYTSPFVYEVGQKSKVLYGKDITPQLRKASQKVSVFMKRGALLGWQIAE